MVNKPIISLIAAIGKNRELGKGNDLIFQIPEDMKLFRDTTRGHAVIMGRKTYESIGRPLPQRTNIIVSRSTDYVVPERVLKAQSIEQALEIAKQHEKEEIMVIGGAQIYTLALPFADKLYLTLVDAEVKDADAFFPDYSDFKNIVTKKESSDKNYKYTFLELTH